MTLPYCSSGQLPCLFWEMFKADQVAFRAKRLKNMTDDVSDPCYSGDTDDNLPRPQSVTRNAANSAVTCISSNGNTSNNREQSLLGNMQLLLFNVPRMQLAGVSDQEVSIILKELRQFTGEGGASRPKRRSDRKRARTLENEMKEKESTSNYTTGEIAQEKRNAYGKRRKIKEVMAENEDLKKKVKELEKTIEEQKKNYELVPQKDMMKQNIIVRIALLCKEQLNALRQMLRNLKKKFPSMRFSITEGNTRNPDGDIP